MFNISSWWKNRPRQQFSEMPQWLLAIFGGGAFLVAGYVGLALKELVPTWISTVNKIGYFDTLGTAIGGLLLIWGVAFWFFSCVAARCHGLLYEQWFK